MRANLSHPRRLLALLTLVLTLQATRGDETVYWDFDNGFTPNLVRIGAGQVVTWVNVDPYGFPVTITIGGTLSFTLQPYEQQGVAFPSTGTFSMRSDSGDNGSVVVGVPPQITITQPAGGAVFQAPAAVTIAATASAASGIYSVQFYVEGPFSFDLVAEVFSPPYVATTNLDEGSYTLWAVATDNEFIPNADSVNITVTPPPMKLIHPRVESGQVVFDAQGLQPGWPLVVLCRTNLTAGEWLPVATNYPSSTSETFTNTMDGGQLFYRLEQQL
jgi:hypothetical protein